MAALATAPSLPLIPLIKPPITCLPLSSKAVAAPLRAFLHLVSASLTALPASPTLLLIPLIRPPISFPPASANPPTAPAAKDTAALITA